MLIAALSGCRGPEGPAGIDPQGIDVLPPTVQMSDPWPLGRYWDQMLIAASAVDNVTVDRVVFTLDGSPAVGSITMIASIPPYRFILPLDEVLSGWHFVGARAYDLAGNVTEAAPRSVWVGHSSDLSDTTIKMAYHNGISSSVYTIPDSMRAEALWVRFTPAKKAVIRSVKFQLGGVFSDSSQIQVTLWTGASIPTTAGVSVSLPAVGFAGEIRQAEFNFPSGQDTVRTEFYIVLDILKQSEADTLRFASDNGEPPWGRSGIRDDGGYSYFTELYGTTNNLIATTELYYPQVVDTTGG